MFNTVNIFVPFFFWPRWNLKPIQTKISLNLLHQIHKPQQNYLSSLWLPPTTARKEHSGNYLSNLVVNKKRILRQLLPRQTCLLCWTFEPNL